MLTSSLQGCIYGVIRELVCCVDKVTATDSHQWQEVTLYQALVMTSPNHQSP